MQLIVPRVTFNSEGQTLYMQQFLKPKKWTYLRENVETSNSTTQRTGTFKISSELFVFTINDAAIDNQKQNPLLYNTFSIANDRMLVNAFLEIGNGNEYPEVAYQPSRVYRDVL